MAIWTMRAVVQDDVPTIAAHRYYDEQATPADHLAYQAWLTRALIEQRYFGFVALAGERLIAGAGVVRLDWGPTRDDPNPYRGRVVNVFTAPAWRKQGIARQLLQATLAAAKQHGIHSFNLAASADGASLYQALGFQPYPTEMRMLSSAIPRK